ncbi:TCR/Tet family MFS transporter [Cognatishimia sp. MH4019]|uniref:TCR/Tet family MFS transporter n=1 Tax=Cognatishimia sp. MH4019 TaxID=2854030 RepID=UPI001CD5C31A|nr:TCR/Tet family MFS transporter [Cognatishimia sp. MH4019]
MTTETPSTRLPFTFILITLVLDAMGIGLILPVMPDLIRDVNGGDLGEAAVWGGVLATTFAVMQFLFGPTLGSLSDRYGRRPILLISLAVMAVDYLVMAVAGTIWLLFLTRVVGGITAATQSTAGAFIADISPPEKKAQNFGLIGAAFGMGFIFGPMIGGLLSEFGHRAPFYAAAALATANLIFGYFVMPETVTNRIRRPFDWSRANPFGAFQALGRLPGVARLLLLVFLYEFAFIVYPATWAFFTQERFGWSPAMVGLSLASFGVSMAIVQGGIIRWIIPRFGDRNTVIYGFLFNFFAFTVLMLLSSGWVALAFTPITALGAVVTPAVQGMMSRIASDDQQGELQGVIASSKAVAMILSPLVMTQVFWMFTSGDGLYLPGAPFGLAAALMLVCFAVFVMRPRRAVA